MHCITKFALSVVLVASACSTVSGQTAIAVFRNSTDIVAASDSKFGAPDGTTSVGCKVHRLGNLFYLVAGMTGDYDKIIAAARKKNSTIVETAKAFVPKALPIFEAGYEELQTNSPRDYARFVISEHGKLEFIFFGMDNGAPVIVKAVFHAVPDGNNHVKASVLAFYVTDSSTCPLLPHPCGVTAGNDAAIVSAEKYESGDDMVGMVRRFIQLEIDAVPEKVGPPIRILMLDSHGPRWVENGDGCNIGVPNGQRK